MGADLVSIEALVKDVPRGRWQTYGGRYARADGSQYWQIDTPAGHIEVYDERTIAVFLVQAASIVEELLDEIRRLQARDT